ARASSSLATCRASQRESRLTTWSSGLMHVRGQEHVLSDGLGVETAQVEGRLELAEESRAGAGEPRGDEEQQLVDETLGEERRRERRAALEQERLDALGGERLELVADRAGSRLEPRSRRERPAAEGEPPR